MPVHLIPTRGYSAGLSYIGYLLTRGYGLLGPQPYATTDKYYEILDFIEYSDVLGFKEYAATVKLEID